ncbi:MAG TPA: heparin lyase I family protein [Telluria sp.]
MKLNKLMMRAALSAAFGALPLAPALAADPLPPATVGSFTPILKVTRVAIGQGGSADVGLSVESHGGYAGTVTVSLPLSTPAGISMAPIQVAVAARQVVQTSFRIKVAPEAPVGEQTVSVRYDSGSLHKNWPLVVAVGALTPPTAARRIRYGYLPAGSQKINGGASTYWTVPNTQIHQTSWAQSPGSAPNLQANYAYPDGLWYALQWRWADTMRSNAITTVASPGSPSYPAYRFEIRPSDHASPGTAGDHPRAELFSVDGYEAARGRTPPRQNIVKQGDEYWATWSMYLAPDFPTNHKWATLFQRKFDNKENALNTRSWFSVNVHGDRIDYSLPQACALNACDYSQTFMTSVTAARGKWTTFKIHEKASTGSDGLFELYMNDRLVERRYGATIEHASADYNFHYGYYRANERMNAASQPPGTGVIYFSPLMIARVTPIGVPGIPNGVPSFVPLTP